MARRLFAQLAAGASALFIAAVAVPSGAVGPRSDEAPPPAPATDGPTVYTESCAKCHGADGKGDTGMGKKARDKGKNWPDLTKSTVSADKAKEIIENGVAGSLMKAYKEKLSAEAIANVRDYVIGLRAGATP